MRGAPLSMKSCILAALLSIGAVQLAFAQQPAPEPVIESERSERADPPSRVARLSHIEGTVSLAPAGTEEWAEAALNRPLTDGDRLWVEDGGRAELQMGSSTVHLDERTGFSFLDLGDDALQMNLTEGAIVIHVRRKLQSERIEVDTPNTVVSLLHPGEYHIEVNEAGDTTVVRTRSGETEVAGERQTYTLRAGEQGVFTGTADLAADIKQLDSRTAFENWANDRERRAERATSSRYVSRDVIGYEDLDRYGEWVREPEYGHVWRPIYVSSGWAPYRDGRWVWVSPWGWTWVDAAPWGFAPFHYGRWAYLRSRWCWVPGPIHVRPVYAPALVAWVGGPRVGVSVSFGSAIGWYPLGPREIYVPGYWYSRRYIHHVNVSNTFIINNTYIDRIYDGRRHGHYRYRRYPHAITAVNREAFISGRPVRDRRIDVNERTLRDWRADPRAPAIAPDRHSVLAGRQIEGRSLARVVERNREIAARRSVPARVSFDAERRAVEANGGRPVDRSRLFGRVDDRADRRSLRQEAQVTRSGSNLTRTPSSDERRDRAQALSDRPQGGGAIVQQWRGRERPKETTQPRVYENRPPQAREPSGVARTETSPARSPRNGERTRDSVGTRSFTAPTAPSRQTWQQAESDARRRSEIRSSRAEERQRAPSGSIIQEHRSQQPSTQRFERAPQQRIERAPQRVESMRAPTPAPRQESPRQHSSVERSMPQQSIHSGGGSSRSGGGSSSRSEGGRGRAAGGERGR